MVFPLDVHRKVAETRKLVGQDRTAVLIQLFCFVNIICFFVLRFIFKSFLMVSTKWALLTQVVLFLTLGIFFFRFVIFREDEKVREYKGYESDSFAKFLYLRKDSEETLDIRQEKVSVFEYANGTATCTMCFKFGSNDDVRARNTRQVLDVIVGLIADYGFESRIVSSPEDFSNSIEFKQHVSVVNSVEDRVLAKVLRDVSKAVIDTSHAESNVDEIYLTIRTATNYQKYELEGLLKAIFKVLLENVTAFRSVSFLDMDELLEFYRYFYTIEAIDLAMMRALDLAAELDEDYRKIVSLHTIISEDGKRYHPGNQNVELPIATKERRVN